MRAMDGECNCGIQRPVTAFESCLVEASGGIGRRRTSRRGVALGLSAIAQLIAVAGFLIVPLFAGVNRLVIPEMVVVRPYSAPKSPQPMTGRRTSRPPAEVTHPPRPQLNYTQIIAPDRVSGRIATVEDAPTVDTLPPGVGLGQENDAGPIGLIGLSDGRKANALPQPPAPAVKTSEPAKPVAVSEGVELAMLLTRVKPVYPVIAKQAHIEGTVELHAIISREGRIEKLEVLGGNAALALAARDAVLQWRFRPTMLNKEPVEVETYITVNFKLDQ
jgi:periplasmic protein TonB